MFERSLKKRRGSGGASPFRERCRRAHRSIPNALVLWVYFYKLDKLCAKKHLAAAIFQCRRVDSSRQSCKFVTRSTLRPCSPLRHSGKRDAKGALAAINPMRPLWATRPLQTRAPFGSGALKRRQLAAARRALPAGKRVAVGHKVSAREKLAASALIASGAQRPRSRCAERATDVSPLLSSFAPRLGTSQLLIFFFL